MTIKQELDLAITVAMEMTKEFDFDCREVLSSEKVRDSNGLAVYRIVARLWSSRERIAETLLKSGDGQDVEFMREVLSYGNKIAIEATCNDVVSHEWIGLQLS